MLCFNKYIWLQKDLKHTSNSLNILNIHFQFLGGSIKSLNSPLPSFIVKGHHLFTQNIMIKKYLIFSLCLCSLIYAKDIKYFSNFKPGPQQVGRESVVTDFVTLTSGPGSDLPNRFTVCTSLFVDILTTTQSMFQIMKKDGTAWFFIFQDVKSKYSTREDLFYCIQAGKYLPCQGLIISTLLLR